MEVDFWLKVPVRPNRARPKLVPPLYHEVDRLQAKRGRLDKKDRPPPEIKGIPKKRQKKGPTL
jgi:hypothetical protein